MSGDNIEELPPDGDLRQRYLHRMEPTSDEEKGTEEEEVAYSTPVTEEKKEEEEEVAYSTPVTEEKKEEEEEVAYSTPVTEEKKEEEDVSPGTERESSNEEKEVREKNKK